MNTPTVVLPSLSAAMDGGFTGIADVSRAMAAVGNADDYRLIGGVAVITTEVPGLAEALRRPAISISAELHLTDGAMLVATTALPDAIGLLAMKAGVRSVRDERRDAEDLWRCLEIAATENVEPSDFDDDALAWLRETLWLELGPGGRSIPDLTLPLQDAAAARLRTRLRALLTDVAGQDPRTSGSDRNFPPD